MIQDDIIRIKNSKTFLSDHLSVLTTMERYGFLNLLRKVGRASIQLKDTNTAALTGAYQSGWQAALDYIEFFKEIVLTELDTTKQPRADFGSVDRALKEGDLMEEEANGIRTNTPAEYARVTGTPGKYVSQPIVSKSSTTI